MLQYLGLDDMWHSLDLMAVKEICSGGTDYMIIHMKDDSAVIAHLITSC